MDARLMITKEAADYCRLSVSLLKKHGPAPIKIGASVRYDRKALDAWIDQLGGNASENDAEAQALAALLE